MYRREVTGPFRELKIGLLIGSGLLPVGHEVARRRSSSEFDERRRQSLGSPTRRVRSSNRASSRNRRDLDLQTDQRKMMLFDCVIKPVECHVPLAQCSMDSNNPNTAILRRTKRLLRLPRSSPDELSAEIRCF